MKTYLSLLLSLCLLILSGCQGQYHDVDYLLETKIGGKYNPAEGGLPLLEAHGSPVYQTTIDYQGVELKRWVRQFDLKVSLLSGNVYELNATINRWPRTIECLEARDSMLALLAEFYQQDPDFNGDVQFISRDGNRHFISHCEKDDQGKEKVTIRLVALDELQQIEEYQLASN